MKPALKDRIEQLISQSKLVVFMKGDKLMPKCGFSNNVVNILNTIGVSYTTIDVISDPELREGIKAYSQWPTIPQIYLNGEFLGGSDILTQLNETEELLDILDQAFHTKQP
jgi:monothiol glutaredoxin